MLTIRTMALLLLASLALAASPQSIGQPLTCVRKLAIEGLPSTDETKIMSVLEHAGTKYVVTPSGWYEAKAGNDSVRLKMLAPPSAGLPGGWRPADGDRFFVRRYPHWSIVRRQGDSLDFRDVTSASGPLRLDSFVADVGNGRWIVSADSALYLLRPTADGAEAVRLPETVGQPLGPSKRFMRGHVVHIPGIGLVGHGKFGVHRLQLEGKPSTEPLVVGDAGAVTAVTELPKAGFVVETRRGWFFRALRDSSGALVPGPSLVADGFVGELPAGDSLYGVQTRDTVYAVFKKPDGTWALGPKPDFRIEPGYRIDTMGPGELFVTTSDGSRKVVLRVDPNGRMVKEDLDSSLAELSGVLLNAESGWVGDPVLGTIDGRFRVKRSGSQLMLEKLPGRGRLMRATVVQGMALYRDAQGWWAIPPRAGAPAVEVPGPSGEVSWQRQFPLPGALFTLLPGPGLGQELWHAYVEGGLMRISRVRHEVPVSEFVSAHDAPGPEVWTPSDAVRLETTPFSSATVALQNVLPLNAKKEDFLLRFAVAHPCASAVADQGVEVWATSPKHPARKIGGAFVERDATSSQRVGITVPVQLTDAGPWRFEFRAKDTGAMLGRGSDLQVEEASLEDTARKFAGWIALAVPILLALANIGVFIAARYSTWAWNVATDNSWATSAARGLTFAMCHWPPAALWVLDRYYQRMREHVEAAGPFVPLPLTAVKGRQNEGATVSPSTSDLVAGPSLKGKRVWIQGGSGMGKTALFKNLVVRHFSLRDAFEAYRAWGCVLVPFAARDHTVGTKDKADPAWVVEAAKLELASVGMAFASDALLRALLRAGVIGIAIDGVQEAGRADAVEAFALGFPAAPMFVTSQDSVERAFDTWRLPSTMADFVPAFVRAHAGPENAERFASAIQSSPIASEVQSGYDLKLMLDLLSAESLPAALPSTRSELYAQVVDLGWPAANDKLASEQKFMLAAAAWKMLTDRDVQQGKRRMVAGNDLDASLLNALADAPHGPQAAPVRIVSRVGDEFEFVHDNMQAYLAARWFTTLDLGPERRLALLDGSKLHLESPEALDSLWRFIALLLDDEPLFGLRKALDKVARWANLRVHLREEVERRGLDAGPQDG